MTKINSNRFGKFASDENIVNAPLKPATWTLSLTLWVAIILCGGSACGAVDNAVADADNTVVDADNTVVDADNAAVDAEATPDAVEQCVTGRSCVPAPPTGWAGPTLFYEGAANVVAPSCPAEYPTEQDNFQGLTAGGACDCECGTATGLTCGSTVARRNGTNTCNDVPDALGTFAPNVCQAVSIAANKNFISVGQGSASGGSCAPNTVDTLQTPSFQTLSRTCDGATVSIADCSTGNVCAPDPSSGFNTQHCITSPGDVACPSGSAYDQRTLVVGGFTDNRSCATCGCGTPSGSCSGSITFIDDCTATLPVFYAQVSTNACGQVSALARGASYSPTNPTGSCVATAGAIDGAVQLDNATTVCCLP